MEFLNYFSNVFTFANNLETPSTILFHSLKFKLIRFNRYPLNLHPLQSF